MAADTQSDRELYLGRLASAHEAWLESTMHRAFHAPIGPAKLDCLLEAHALGMSQVLAYSNDRGELRRLAFRLQLWSSVWLEDRQWEEPATPIEPVPDSDEIDAGRPLLIQAIVSRYMSQTRRVVAEDTLPRDPKATVTVLRAQLDAIKTLLANCPGREALIRNFSRRMHDAARSAWTPYDHPLLATLGPPSDDDELNLDQEELDFLERYGLSPSDVLDATFLSASDRQSALIRTGKLLALAGRRCLNGHRFKKHSNHCVQCDPRRLRYKADFETAGYVYLLYSDSAALAKVGITRNEPSIRINEVCRRRYADADDWRTISYAWHEQAGKVEDDLRKALCEFRVNRTYMHDGRPTRAREAFDIDLADAVDVFREMTKS